MKFVHKITVCVFGSWNKINPFITKYSKNRHFFKTFITVRRMLYPNYDLWNNKADIVISYFNDKWALLVHWWQRQPAVEDSLRRDERTPDTPRAKPCVQPREAALHFEVGLSQHWYAGSYKAIFSIMLRRDEYFINISLSIQILLEANKVHLAVVGDASYTVTDMRRTTNVGKRLKRSPVN